MQTPGKYFEGLLKKQKKRFTYLSVDPVDLPILILQLWAHVQGHIPQVSDHGVHLAHVLLHLVLTRVICYPAGDQDICVNEAILLPCLPQSLLLLLSPSPANITGLWTDSIPIVHHALRLIIYYFAVVVTLPGTVVFLEWGTPADKQTPRVVNSRFLHCLSLTIN